MEYTSSSLKNALESQIRRLKQKTVDLKKLSSRISTIRLLDFLIGLGIVYLAARSGYPWLFWLMLVVFIGSFMALISWHRRIDTAIKQFSGLMEIRSHHLARLTLNWDDIPLSTQGKNYESHPFARDFNITGSRSVLHLMDTATYPGGKAHLEEWLLNREPDSPKTEARQKLVKELKPMAHFRDRLHLYADMASKQKTETDWSMDELLLGLRSSQKSGFNLPLLILGSLAALNITLLILTLVGLMKPYVIITFVIYLLTYIFYGPKISGLFNEASQIDKLLSRFRAVLLYLETFPYKKDSALASFCNLYRRGDERPSRFLKKIIAIASAASSQNSDLLWLLLNCIVPWDMFFAKKLNTYKKELEPKLDRWLDHFYRLEALNSLANFAWLNPKYLFSLPHKEQKEPVFEAKDLGHPLIPANQKITNDVSIEHTGDIFLITGSNMAGKSTFLRTVGINLALCFAGAPVNASSFDTIPFRLFSSINVTDSLDEGLSHFYAEVKRLRALLDELKKPHKHPLFFMVDEIYRGTNNRERLAGSTAFLKHISGKDGVGMVTTHDLELAQLEGEISALSNWHFEETIEDGKMRFEYKLKPGPCPSTNALKIMQMEGLPV